MAPTTFGLFRTPAPSNSFRLITEASNSQAVMTFGSTIINILQLQQCCLADKHYQLRKTVLQWSLPFQKHSEQNINKKNGKHIQGRKGNFLR